MVDSTYMLGKAAPPSRTTVLVNQTVMPVLIDLAAAVEAELERISRRACDAPLVGLGIACALGGMLSLMLRRR